MKKYGWRKTELLLRGQVYTTWVLPLAPGMQLWVRDAKEGWHISGKKNTWKDRFFGELVLTDRQQNKIGSLNNCLVFAHSLELAQTRVQAKAQVLLSVAHTKLTTTSMVQFARDLGSTSKHIAQEG